MFHEHRAMVGLVLAIAATTSLPTRAQTLARPPSATAPGEDLRARFAGPAFAYAGGDLERASLDAAIHRATDPMNFLTRGIARGRLRDKNPVYPTIAFAFPAGQVAITYGGRATLRARDDGTPGSGTSYTNESVRVTHRFEGSTLVEVLSTHEGSRRNEFHVSTDGRMLVLRVTLTSGQLPRPLEYGLTYRR